MPNEKIDIETDENPDTAYEDTAGHDSTGYTPENSKQIVRAELEEPVDGVEV